MNEDLTLNISDDMKIDLSPKNATGLIQIPEDATLKEVIEFLNDMNFTVFGDDELAKRWNKWMPNTVKEKGIARNEE